MSNSIEVQGTLELRRYCQKPLDENAWNTWLEKNTAEERRRTATRMAAVKWACIGVLMVAAGASSYIATPYVSAYQTVVRFTIGLGAIFILFESIRIRQYAFTVLFGAIVLLFNPVLPTFLLSAHSVILLASVFPFVACLFWMKEPTRRVRAVLTTAVR